DRTPHRAAMALRPRPYRCAGTRRGLVVAAAALLDRRAGSVGSPGGSANGETEKIMSDVEDAVLRMERLIPSPPEMLFALWIEPADLVKWWAPDGYVAEVDTLDVRPDGRWRTVLRRPDGSGVAASGVYRLLEPPHRLAFTWAGEDASGTRGHETEVSVSFEPAPGGT